MCRDSVCTEAASELRYLQDLSDVLLYLLLPQQEFEAGPVRCVLYFSTVVGTVHDYSMEGGGGILKEAGKYPPPLRAHDCNSMRSCAQKIRIKINQYS